MRLPILLLVACLLLSAEHFNSIYIGEDVSWNKQVAVSIDENGIVTAYIGAVVPNLHDRYGNAVRVTGIRKR